MIKRELYMSRIRPFIGGELIKVMTGIRRSGKSVMLDLIKEELETSLDKGTQRKTTENELPSLTQCTA